MKLYQEQIHVDTREGVPHRIIWRLQPYRVLKVEEKWLYHGRWWTTPKLKGCYRRYYRLDVAPVAGTALVMEVFEERGRWVLSRLED